MLKHKILCYRNKLITYCKSVLIVTVPILINRAVFEPSCSVLQSTVPISNYLCTNLAGGGLHSQAMLGLSRTHHFNSPSSSLLSSKMVAVMRKENRGRVRSREPCAKASK